MTAISTIHGLIVVLAMVGGAGLFCWLLWEIDPTRPKR